MSYRSVFLLTVCAFLAAANGCQSEQGGGASAEPPGIPVSRPVLREVTNYEEYTGRTDAVEMVDVRARVTGYLDNMPFKEGTEVKKDDVLFEIDPLPYRAQLEQAKSQVALNEASVKLAKRNLERDLAAQNAVSQQQLDQDRAVVDEAEARLTASKESTKVYELNLQYTKVRSKIDGMVSRYYVTRGNTVIQDQTLLTTIVKLDPMYVYFDMDEPSFLRINRAIVEGRLNLPEDGTMSVLMGLQNEEGYSHTGTVNFRNNQVNSNTGSIAMRAKFANPWLPKGLPALSAGTVGVLAAPQGQGPLPALAPLAGAKGTRLLAPGMFVRIRLPIGDPYPARLVIDRAIQSDQGLKYVYVVDKDDKVQYRRVKTGPLQSDGLRVIEGVEPDEWIVVGAIQQVRPKMAIKPQPTDMPSLAAGQGDKGTKGQGAEH
jgi:multidrug efflux system membrane fusion protein